MKGVSVIVCCYNSVLRLSKTLECLSKQVTIDALPWEVIIVDNASSDNTKEAARLKWTNLGRGDVGFRIVEQEIQGLSFAREKGVAESKYDVIIFCDDDNWLACDYIQQASSIMSSNGLIGALGGVGTAVCEGELPSWFQKFRYSFACYAQGDEDGELISPTASLYGAGLTIRRDVLQKLSNRSYKPLLTDRIGGSLVSGGDTELCYAIRLVGYKLWFSSKLEFYHYIPSSRLTKKYLYRLNRSLSYCSANLIVYKYVLLGKEVTNIMWWKDVCYQFFLCANSLMRFLVLSNPLLERKLGLDFSYNSLKSFVYQFGKYRVRYKVILRLRD